MNSRKLSLYLSLLSTLSLQAKTTPLMDWFSNPAPKRGATPETQYNLDTPEKVAEAKAKVWNAYKAGVIKRGWDKAIPAEPKAMKDWIKDGSIKPLKVNIGDKTMPYVVITKGKKPNGGWPLFFCLHGGGGNPKANGPHAWPVNTREWVAQMQLTTKVWDSPGIYIIPRMADDREGRWYYGYNQVFIDQMIQKAIISHDVDPNRVYLEGISEGGYAAYRLGSMMADRWAGSCSLAAAEPISNAPPENLRHVPFRCGIGEHDTMFNRVGLARNYFKRLEKLAKLHPGEYKHFHDEQKGRGHGVDYKDGPAWIYQFTRNPVPKSITWTVIKQHDRHRNRFYWLALEGDKNSKLYITANSNKQTNTIEITAKQPMKNLRRDATGVKLRVYLDEKLVNLSKPVIIRVNGKVVFNGKVKPSTEAIIRSTAERGDPHQVFAHQVKIELK